MKNSRTLYPCDSCRAFAELDVMIHMDVFWPAADPECSVLCPSCAVKLQALAAETSTEVIFRAA